MKKICLAILMIASSIHVEAQFLKEKSVDISIGYGLSSPDDDTNVVDSGFYLQGEYVLDINKWFDVRPYAGVILTKSGGRDLDGNPTIYTATSNAFLIGGKTRITIPIPWVSPYVEIGFGASIGAFKTFTSYVDLNKHGLIFHVPFSLGLEIGRNHNFDIAFVYYIHPTMDQFAGAAALGVSIPLE